MRWTSPNDRIQASICRYPCRVVAKHRVPENTIPFIDDRRDMQILVGVHAADDVTPCLSSTSIPSLLVRPCFDGFAKTECVDRTVT